MFAATDHLIEYVKIQNCTFEFIYVNANVGLNGSVIYQEDGKTVMDHQKLFSDSKSAKITLRKTNMASQNDVYIILTRTYNKAPVASSRILTGRILGTSALGTLYLSDNNVTSSGGVAPFNWLYFVVLPVIGVLVLVAIGVIVMCCCRKKTEESKPVDGKARYKAGSSNDINSKRTVDDVSTQNIDMPFTMNSDRSMGGKGDRLDRGRKDKTAENSPSRGRSPSPGGGGHDEPSGNEFEGDELMKFAMKNNPEKRNLKNRSRENSDRSVSPRRRRSPEKGRDRSQDKSPRRQRPTNRDVERSPRKRVQEEKKDSFDDSMEDVGNIQTSAIQRSNIRRGRN